VLAVDQLSPEGYQAEKPGAKEQNWTGFRCRDDIAFKCPKRSATFTFVTTTFKAVHPALQRPSKAMKKSAPPALVRPGEKSRDNTGVPSAYELLAIITSSLAEYKPSSTTE